MNKYEDILMEKKSLFSVLIVVILITISFTGCFSDDDKKQVEIEVESFLEATKDDIKITLENTNRTSESFIIVTSVIENIRNYTIYLVGGFRSTVSIENTINSTDKQYRTIWTESHNGEKWYAYHNETIIIYLNLSKNETSHINEYKIRHQFTFKKSGGNSTDEISINSNFLQYNTKRRILDFYISDYIRWDN